MHISEFTATWHMRGHDESFRLLDRIISYTFVCSTDRSYTYTQLVIPRHRNVSTSNRRLPLCRARIVKSQACGYKRTMVRYSPPTHPPTHPPPTMR